MKVKLKPRFFAFITFFIFIIYYMICSTWSAAEETHIISETTPLIPATPTVTLMITTPTSTPYIESKNYTDDDLYWLAKIVTAETGNDTDEGQQAVANVVLNRVNHPDFPDTIYSVIWQKTGKVWQFSPCGDGNIKKEPTERAIENARLILEGKRVLPDDILFFYMPTKGNQKNWIRTRKIYKKIGVHRFCY